MFDFLLDETTNDLVLTDKDLVFTTTTQEELRQRLSIRLLTYKGEWFLNESYGIPYTQEIIGVTRSKKTVDNILLSNAKLELSTSDSISNFESSYGLDTRKYHMSFDVSTVDGIVKVDINSDPSSEYIYPEPTVFNPYAGCGDTIEISNNLFDYVDISGLPATNPNTGLPNDNTWVNNWVTNAPQTLSLKVQAGAFHTVGLKSDGSVIATGRNTDGQCNVSLWSDIIDISVGADHTVGLKADGSVIATGRNIYGQCNVSGWSNIIAISAGSAHTAGLKSDGSVIAIGYDLYHECDTSGWSNIISIDAGLMHTVGLKADGSVIATGRDTEGQCGTSGWSNIGSISAGQSHTVGLKADGSVIATDISYDDNYGQCDTSGWSNIKAVSAGYHHTVGLKADGSVIVIGLNTDGQCDTSGWPNSDGISAGGWSTVSYKSDGSVIAIGFNDDGQCNVSGWDLLV